MEELRLDWSSAEVSDGCLTVPLTGDADSTWTEEFAWVAERLSGGGSVTWGEVKAAKKKVTVAAVKPGSESDVRHFLESIVQQVNADQAKTDEDSKERESGEDETGPDGQMTEAFRGFGEPSEDSAEHS
jgi:DNA-binding ferritin-like protein